MFSEMAIGAEYLDDGRVLIPSEPNAEGHDSNSLLTSMHFSDCCTVCLAIIIFVVELQVRSITLAATYTLGPVSLKCLSAEFLPIAIVISISLIFVFLCVPSRAIEAWSASYSSLFCLARTMNTKSLTFSFLVKFLAFIIHVSHYITEMRPWL